MQKDSYPIKWSAFEYIYTQKNSSWFWFWWIISGGIIITAIISGNILFAILVFVSIFALSLQAVRKPRLIKFEINNDGIIIDNKLYYYNLLESYCIKTNKVSSKIILKSKHKFMPLIIVPLGNINSQKVNAYLEKHLKIKEYEEPLTSKLEKFL